MAVIIPAAELYAVDKSEFAAGFRIREWWADLPRQHKRIHRRIWNLLYCDHGLDVRLPDHYGYSYSLVSDALPPACADHIPAFIMYATIAQAYKVGKEKLAQAEAAPSEYVQ